MSYYVVKNNEMSQGRDPLLALVKPEVNLLISCREDNFKCTFFQKEPCQLLGILLKMGKKIAIFKTNTNQFTHFVFTCMLSIQRAR